MVNIWVAILCMFVATLVTNVCWYLYVSSIRKSINVGTLFVIDYENGEKQIYISVNGEEIINNPPTHGLVNIVKKKV